jgi:hypothetical protein
MEQAYILAIVAITVIVVVPFFRFYMAPDPTDRRRRL